MRREKVRRLDMLAINLKDKLTHNDVVIARSYLGGEIPI